MALPRTRHTTYPRPAAVRHARQSVAPLVLTWTDAAAFGVLVVAAIALPTIFSIENADVFVLPKTVVAVGLAALLVPILAIRWLAATWSLADLRRKPLVWALLGFVALNLLAAAFAIDRQHALLGEELQYQGLVTTLTYPIYLVAAWTSVRSDGRRTWLLWAIAVGAAVAAIYAITQRLGLDPIWDSPFEGRVFSTFGQPNWLAAFFVMAIPLTVALAARRHLVVQIALAALAVAEVGALAFTLSRGGFLGAGVAALVVASVLALRRDVLSWRGVAIAGVAALLLIGATLAYPQTRSAIGNVIQRIGMIDDTQEPSASAHLDQWAVGLAIAADYPLAGAGQDSYVLLFDDYRDSVLPADRARIWDKYRPESPHNHFLAIAGGMGIPALIAYLAIIGAAVVRGMRGVRRSIDSRTVIVGAAFLAAIAGHLVTDSFVTAETAASVVFWMILGATAALGSVRTTPDAPSVPAGIGCFLSA